MQSSVTSWEGAGVARSSVTSWEGTSIMQSSVTSRGGDGVARSSVTSWEGAGATQALCFNVIKSEEKIKRKTHISLPKPGLSGPPSPKRKGKNCDRYRKESSHTIKAHFL